LDKGKSTCALYSDEFLELYALGGMQPSDIAGLEEHLLFCHDCLDRIEDTEAFVQTLRRALRELSVPEVARGSQTVELERDRRAEPRVPGHADLEILLAKDRRTGRIIPATLVDVSSRGLGFLCSWPFGLGRRLAVKIDEEVRHAVIRHVSSAAGGFRVGVEFV
jgi:hypothetical protein